MFEIVNDAALAYKGVIPEDRWHDPYMPMSELQHEIDAALYSGDTRPTANCSASWASKKYRT